MSYNLIFIAIPEVRALLKMTLNQSAIIIFIHIYVADIFLKLFIIHEIAA